MKKIMMTIQLCVIVNLLNAQNEQIQAQMVISSAAGNVIRQIPLPSGTDSITIEDGTLPTGVYYYSLYVGNGLVDTKKMILTK
jgi:hypothetical protein